MLKKLTTCLAGLTCIVTTGGCMSTLTGAGEMGMGYRSETKVFLYHEVDGDKDGVESKSELDLEPLLDLIIRYQDSRMDEVEEPSTSDSE